jgi:hypothetical protein
VREDRSTGRDTDKEEEEEEEEENGMEWESKRSEGVAEALGDLGLLAVCGAEERETRDDSVAVVASMS